MVESSFKVHSHKESAFEKTWALRSAGLWGTAALATAYGLALGAIAPFFPVLTGQQTLAGAAALIPHSLAIFATVGMVTGVGLGAAVGAPAGAAASVAEEQERRMRERDIALGLSTPQRERIISESLRPEPDTRGIVRKFFDTLNFKSGATFAVLGMLGGALMAASYIALGGLNGGAASSALPGLSTLLGEAASHNAVAVTTYFMGVMGGFGAMFGTNGPKLGTHMQDVAGKLLRGESLRARWEPEKAQEKSAAEENAPPLAPQAKPRRPSMPDVIVLSDSVTHRSTQLTLH